MRYRVELIREVTDIVSAVVTVEATNEEEAKGKALALADTDTLQFDFDQCGDTGETSVNEIYALDDDAAAASSS